MLERYNEGKEKPGSELGTGLNTEHYAVDR
jgi:hypothetical protein